MADLDEVLRVVTAIASDLRLHAQKSDSAAAAILDTQARMGDAAEKATETTRALQMILQRMDERDERAAAAATKKNGGAASLDVGGLKVTPKAALQALTAAVLLGAALRGGGAAVEMLKALVK